MLCAIATNCRVHFPSPTSPFSPFGMAVLPFSPRSQLLMVYLHGATLGWPTGRGGLRIGSLWAILIIFIFSKAKTSRRSDGAFPATRLGPDGIRWRWWRWWVVGARVIYFWENKWIRRREDRTVAASAVVASTILGGAFVSGECAEGFSHFTTFELNCLFKANAGTGDFSGRAN